MSFSASSLKFGLAIHFSVLSVALLILAQMSMISTFVPTANLIRTFLALIYSTKNILTVSIWLIITGALSLRALSRRN